MGVDLTLLPHKYGPYSPDAPTPWHTAYDRLSLTHNKDLLALVQELEDQHSRPMPEDIPVDWYGDDGLKRITQTPYGFPLRYVTAGQLATISPPDSTSDWNRGVWAFLARLPADTPVILYWH